MKSLRRGLKLTVRAAIVARSGFRSPPGQLGRNLTLQLNARSIAIFDKEVKGWQGVPPGMPGARIHERGHPPDHGGEPAPIPAWYEAPHVRGAMTMAGKHGTWGGCEESRYNLLGQRSTGSPGQRCAETTQSWCTLSTRSLQRRNTNGPDVAASRGKENLICSSYPQTLPVRERRLTRVLQGFRFHLEGDERRWSIDFPAAARTGDALRQDRVSPFLFYKARAGVWVRVDSVP